MDPCSWILTPGSLDPWILGKLDPWEIGSLILDPWILGALHVVGSLDPCSPSGSSVPTRKAAFLGALQQATPALRAASRQSVSLKEAGGERVGLQPNQWGEMLELSGRVGREVGAAYIALQSEARELAEWAGAEVPKCFEAETADFGGVRSGGFRAAATVAREELLAKGVAKALEVHSSQLKR